jgi:hypothetical protein
VTLTARPPADLPKRLAELKDLVRAAGNRIFALDATATIAELRDAAGLLDEAARTARNITQPSATGCTIHPAGPVDPDPPNGWLRCLLCNGRRRRAEQQITNPNTFWKGPR